MRVKVLFLLMVVMSAGVLLAQTNIATVRGTVTDPSGAAVPGVVINVTDIVSNVQARSLVSDAVGNYEVPNLRPGRYRITADITGFRTFVADDVLLEGGQVRRVDISLELGSKTETVTVEAGASVIQTETGRISVELDKSKFVDRPAVDYYPSPLSLLGTASGIQGNQWAMTMGGITDRQKQDWSMDGVANDTTGDQLDDPHFFEAVQGDAMRTGADSARPVGFTMISKRGGNDFHVNLSYDLINSGLNAREFFSPIKTPYIQHEWFAEASGPIIKNRTFFYFGWFEQRIPLGTWYNSSVPTALMRTGDLSQFAAAVKDPTTGKPFTGNIIPQSRFNAVSSKALDLYYPKPNQGAPNLQTLNFGLAWPYSTQNYIGDWPFVRVDHQLSKNNSLYGRWMQRRTPYLLDGNGLDWSYTTSNRNHQQWMIADTHVFSPRIVNSFTFARQTDYQMGGMELLGKTPLHGDVAVKNLGLQGVNPHNYSVAGFPQINISGLTSLTGTTSAGINDVTNDAWVHTFLESLSWTKGKHVLKFGAEHRRLHWRNPTITRQIYGQFTFNGSYTGNAFADFLLGVPYESIRLDPLTNRSYFNSMSAFYVQDSFKVSSKLTLDLGLRYDYYGLPTYDDGLMWNWDPATGNVIATQPSRINVLYPKNITVVQGNVVPDPDRKNIQPRFGVAYRLTDKSVLRGSYSQYAETWAYDSMLLGAGPYQLSEDYLNQYTNGQPLFQFPNPFPADISKSQVPSQAVQGYPMQTNNGILHRFNASFERQIHNMGFRASYVGSRGTGLNYTLNTNKPQPSTIPFTAARRPFPQFVSTTWTRQDGSWHYDALQIEVQKRAGAFTFNSNWTWAKNLNNYSNTQNPYGVTSNWARNSSDRAHYWSTSVMWNIPVGKGKRYMASAPAVVDQVLGGWQLQIINLLATGQYFSPSFSGSDPSNTGSSGGLPDRIGEGNLPVSQRTDTRWFDAKAFAVPTSGHFGNSAVNVLEGQGIYVTDLTMGKTFFIRERYKISLVGMISDLFNHPHFNNPLTNISAADPGKFTSTVTFFAAEKSAFRIASVKLRVSF